MFSMTPAELKKAVAKVRREANARAMAKDPLWPDRFAKLQAEYLKQHPHLASHTHCGLAADETADVPRKKVTMPNGVVIFSTWYKVPTTEADARKALTEQRWMNENARRHGEGWQVKTV